MTLQRTWTFDRDGKLQIVRRALIPAAARHLLTAIVHVVCDDTRQVTRIIEGTSDDEVWMCDPAMDELAAAVGRKRRTVQLWVRNCLERPAPWLLIDPSENTRHIFTVLWGRLRGLAECEELRPEILHNCAPKFTEIAPRNSSQLRPEIRGAMGGAISGGVGGAARQNQDQETKTLPPPPKPTNQPSQVEDVSLFESAGARGLGVTVTLRHLQQGAGRRLLFERAERRHLVDRHDRRDFLAFCHWLGRQPVAETGVRNHGAFFVWALNAGREQWCYRAERADRDAADAEEKLYAAALQPSTLNSQPSHDDR